MVLDAPHWSNWDWTTVKSGSDGGSIIKAEIDTSKKDEAADRVAKLVGKSGASGTKAEEARTAIMSASGKKEIEAAAKKYVPGTTELVFVSSQEEEAEAGKKTGGATKQSAESKAGGG